MNAQTLIVSFPCGERFNRFFLTWGTGYCKCICILMKVTVSATSIRLLRITVRVSLCVYVFSFSPHCRSLVPQRVSVLLDPFLFLFRPLFSSVLCGVSCAFSEGARRRSGESDVRQTSASHLEEKEIEDTVGPSKIQPSLLLSHYSINSMSVCYVSLEIFTISFTFGLDYCR